MLSSVMEATDSSASSLEPMNTPTKIVLYVVFSLAALFFGNYFFRDYQRANAANPPMEAFGDPMDVEVPNYGASEPPLESATSLDPDQPLAPAEANSETEATPEVPESETPETPVEQASTSEATAVDDALPPPRLGLYGGSVCLVMLCLGVLAAFVKGRPHQWSSTWPLWARVPLREAWAAWASKLQRCSCTDIRPPSCLPRAVAVRCVQTTVWSTVSLGCARPFEGPSM